MNWTKSKIYILSALLAAVSGMSSCKKYLDASPNKQLTVPAVEQDLRAILDNNNAMNTAYSAYGAFASDEYYVSDKNYQSLTDIPAKDYYVWGLNGEPTDKYNDWSTSYSRIFSVNVVLDNITSVKLNGASQQDLNAVKGEALFYRAYSHFQLSQIYALPYNPASASTTLGIPLRLTSDINEKITRPSLREDFGSIITDMKQAVSLLPDISLTKLRPNRPAAYAALANVYLVMQDFKDAQLMADSALNINDSLIDYNTVSASQTAPFPLFNKEVLWQADVAYSSILATSRAKTSNDLYERYTTNDLRKNLYFNNSNGVITYKGHYNGQWQGSSVYFGGLTVDEVYLIKAEAEAREGDVLTAMNVLNTLAKNRFVKDGFIPFSAPDKDSAIHIIMDMREKELCFRGMSRWTDIRRFNQISGEEVTINRQLLGQPYQLNPGDDHYAFLIPQEVIDNSDIQQNTR